MCAPSRTCSRAISTQSSQRPSSMASRNFLEPLAFVRSPIARYEVSWRNGTVWYSEAAPGSGRGSRVGAAGAAHPLDDLAQMLRRRAAAAADQGEAVLADEGLLGVGQLPGVSG